MSSSAHSPAPQASHDGPHASHDDMHYIKVWGALVVLFSISFAGPFLGIRLITLATAFGIAFVKAYLVAKNFMHLDIEKKFVVQLLVVCLGLMLLFFFAVSPDVMKHWGWNWRNDSAKNANIPEVIHHEGGEGAEPAAAEGHAPAAAEGHAAEGAK